MDERHEPIKEFGFRHSFLYGGPVLAYAALIFFLSSLSSFPEAVPSFFGFDKIAHFMEVIAKLFQICSPSLDGRGLGGG
jgi:hypothetical protein